MSDKTMSDEKRAEQDAKREIDMREEFWEFDDLCNVDGNTTEDEDFLCDILIEETEAGDDE